ncbi:MAG: aminotransferase class III-fold pyridoxal phosphate-dependent enzyme [Pseudomonadota bacterium]|nr:aminotransferase class III-fold pyridoxal phosphate-dependent enzyme [Pseudomonadota bacterium]
MWSDQESRFWKEYLQAHYGLGGELERLDGEFDLNIAVRTGGCLDAVLKVMRPDCDPGLVGMQVEALDHLASTIPDLPVPRVIRRHDAAASAAVSGPSGAERIAWVISAIDGMPLGAMRPHPSALIHEIGHTLGRMAEAMKGFDHPALERGFKWHPLRPHWAFSHVVEILDEDLKVMINTYFQKFEESIESEILELKSQAVHCDGNDYNLLVSPSLDGPSLSGVIDFGDMVRAPAVCDLATAAAYMVLDKPRPMEALTALVGGYAAARPMTAREIEMVFPLMMVRLGVSLVNSLIMAREHPDDLYVTVSQAPAIAFLKQALGWNRREVAMRLRVAAGLGIADSAARVCDWLGANRHRFAPVMGAGLADAPMCSIAVGDSVLPTDPTNLTVDECDRLVPAALDGKAVHVGHYLEPRLVYTTDGYLTAPTAVEGRRTMHIGIDLFAPDGRPVHAPLDGEVVTAIDRANPQDYGGTVVLRHMTDGGDAFFTLYGHLDPASISGLKTGDKVGSGAPFATLGSSAVNGGWQPHLHFQLAMCLPDGETVSVDDWPGVADADDLAYFSALHPNPADLLGLAPDKLVYGAADTDSLIEARKHRFGANLKLSYRKPIQILRGWRHYLYDQYGRTHLDAYNNVPHVGHAHPRIAAVIERQSRLLNTNTRYIHPLQMQFADAIRAKLPAHLTHCYFVTSGSEANELALRLARAHGGRRGMIVQDHAYHGHTTGTIDISPYKFNGPGGDGAPDWVEISEVADPYRGRFGYEDLQAGEKYAADVDRAVGALAERGHGLAGFIAESFPSVGGQIEPPAGYLASVYERVRDAGGLCIADEVQTGLGRLGDAYWGFETQQASPDMVILGKPVGNGHPLGVVVTTEEVAASFANGMEFFSTFGGTTLACAIGAEVLAIVDDEGLQANAAAMGDRLLSGLRELQGRFDMIGDVRGRGLFIGVELVTDRSSKSPATALAGYVSNRLRDPRNLIGTDGPDDNVLKIRPPLTIGAADCDLLLAALGDILVEAEVLN